MADLLLSDAQEIAAQLITIGHPYAPAAIGATAMDLVKWCKGKVVAVEGKVIRVTPKEQAEQLIDRARAWEDGWPERGGTRKLQLLFQEMFGKPDEWVPLTYEQTLARGLIRPPCEHCDDSGYVGTRPNIAFCSCRYGLHQREWEGERGLLRINTEPVEQPNAKEIDSLRRKLQ